MRILVLVSRPDAASVNIRDRLLEIAPWTEAGGFAGLPVREHGDFLMAEIDEPHIHADGIDAKMRAAGLRFDAILVASKHRAESGKPALTVHPIGNFGEAQVGGKPQRLVPTAPRIMGRVLRRLASEAKGLAHQVTFEATHHGPYLETPTAFVEIGTDEAAWSDPDIGRRVARAILAAATPGPADAAPVLVALGGSHYAPRASDLARQGRANIGHIIPGYAIERGLSMEVALDAIRCTPGCQGYTMDPRAVAKPPDELLQMFGTLELGWWTDEDLAAR
ncbi:MAG TPA: D-aminoacyl-tRNA deacylase [Candidatus Thermoplasmatota archaeon]|nr:D-aminoacyl-tRNA deacylase [Candidatus Thermoplasmatota archaeon]